MANIVSGKKRTHSFIRNEASELGHISQVRKILKEFKKSGVIISFKRIPAGLNNSLTYRIFFTKKRFYNLILCTAKNIKLSNGVKVVESTGYQLKISLDGNAKPGNIESILKWDILERQKGPLNEEAFYKNMLILIACDKEVSEVIKSIRISEEYEDAIKKIDFFCETLKVKEAPVQLKSSICGQENHKKNHPEIPTINYNRKMPMDLLKKKALGVFRAYPDSIKHL